MSKRFSVAATVALTTFTALISLSSTTAAHAQVTVTTTPFLGMLTETFESFPNYFSQPGFFLSDPTDIFGGAASLSGTVNLIYEPSGGAPWGLGDNGNAQVADGTKGLGANDSNYTATITFDDTVTDFGGFFNAADQLAAGNTDTMTFSFFDAALNSIATENIDVSPSGGSDLKFYGFSSTTAIKVVTITGDYMVMDSLRVNLAPTIPGSGTAPEPASLALFALVGGVAFVARRLKTA